MKVALIGATGFVGAASLAELLNRGHAVTALARHITKLAPQPGLTAAAVDVFDSASLGGAIRDHDIVVSAFNPGWNDAALYDRFMQGHGAIVRGSAESGVKRLLVVGGAGSLFVAPGIQLVDTPEFTAHCPPNIVPGARAARDALTELRNNTQLDWTFVSPPAFLVEGPRTGQYRVGSEELLMAGDRPAGISVADLAVAIVDEIEKPRHRRARFTVAAP
jgi:putative NADH-flavin reductase